MKKETAILFSLILILGASFFLYCKGELAIQKAEEKFTVLAFENTNTECNPQSLAFYIINNSKVAKNFKVSITSNQKKIEKFEIVIPPKSKKNISANPKNLEMICINKDLENYQIKIEENKKEKTIYKGSGNSPITQ